MFGGLHLFVFQPEDDELVKLPVEFLGHALVEVEIDYTALVVYGPGGSVLHRLGHVIHVDILSEHLLRVFVCGRDGSARKADETGVGQGFPHLQCHALFHYLLLGIPLLLAILRAVGLVGHHDDVLALRKRFVALGEFLYRGEQDAAAFSFLQHVCQLLAALCVLGSGAHKLAILREGGEQLLVEVLAVGHNHDGHLRQMLYQQMREEHHRQRLAAALRMPEDTNLPVAGHSLFGPFQGFVHCKVLVIACHHLHLVFLVAVADEVAYNVYQVFLLEDASEERFVVGQRRRFIFPVLRFPFHISLLVGGDGSRPACYHV